MFIHIKLISGLKFGIEAKYKVIFRTQNISFLIVGFIPFIGTFDIFVKKSTDITQDLNVSPGTTAVNLIDQTFQYIYWQ